jgi:hypothetical protein
MIEVEEFNSLKDKNVNNRWSEYRDGSDKYVLKEVMIDSLQDRRRVFFIKDDKKQRDYEMLQASRGITIEKEHASIDVLVSDIEKNQLKVIESDLVRINELEKLLETHGFKVNTLAEMGFRIPRLLNHYKSNGVEAVKGYDVVNLNVLVGQKMGFDVKNKDFNDVESLDLSDLKDVDILLSYHVMEHLSRPDLTIEKIYDNMKKGALMHVEVPIEPGGPMLRYGHLFPFHKGDMKRFLESADFEVISFSEETHPGGPAIERYLVKK